MQGVSYNTEPERRGPHGDRHVVLGKVKEHHHRYRYRPAHKRGGFLQNNTCLSCYSGSEQRYMYENENENAYIIVKLLIHL